MIIAADLSFSSDYVFRLTHGILAFVNGVRGVQLRLPGASVSHEGPLDEVDGVISTKRDRLRWACENGIPAVNPCSNDFSGVPQVCTDNRAIGELVVNHFADRGLQNVGVIHDFKEDVSIPRAEAFIRVCLGRGFAPQVFKHRRGDSLDERNTRLVDALLGMPKPAGIMCMRDTFGFRLVALCERIGIRVPDDVAIVGVNNVELLDGDTTTDLTSIDINSQRIGYTAARLLVEAIGGASIPERTLIPPKELIERRSSDVRPTINPNVTKALDFMRRNLQSRIELEDVVCEQAFGQRALEKHFKESVGTTPMQYLRNIRLEKAKSLLETTALTVTEIGNECGIPDVNYLCRLFRNLYKTTPLKYREITRG